MCGRVPGGTLLLPLLKQREANMTNWLKETRYGKKGIVRVKSKKRGKKGEIS